MTYEELCSFEVLYRAYLEARKGKRNKSKTIEYEANALACTEKLSRKLAVRAARQPGGKIQRKICYIPSKFEVFSCTNPKSVWFMHRLLSIRLHFMRWWIMSFTRL